MEDGQSNSDTNALDINLDDDDLLALIKEPLRESEAYWENTFGLKRVREKNMNLWLPNHWKDYETQVYDYQEMSMYQDNRIFTSVETVASIVNSRIPGLEVMPAQETVIALQVAKDMQKVGHSYIDKYNVMDLFRLSARNLQLKRGGYIKLRWDASKGDFGEIVSEYVQLKDVITDKDAVMGAIPRFQAHKIRNHTLEELIALLPGTEQKIYKAAGMKRTDKKGNLVAYKTQLGKKLDIYEVWFRYFEDGETKSGIAWMDENLQVVIDKDRNPNWNYEEEEGRSANILDEPAPPFIPINYLNDGESYVDQTTLIEEAAPLQIILDKRGFQIMENADQAGSGLVFNTQMINKKDIAKLTGSPDERIGVNGDVRSAVARVAPPPLPNYVIEDKIDARNEIDNIFATHAGATRGEKSGNPTLGQDRMQQNQDLSRIDDIARAVERQATGFVRYLMQMMKVFYTEDHYFKAVGEDGQFDFVVMRSDLIKNGMDIRVEAGSMMPVNKEIQAKWVSDLVSKGLIDPLSVYEVAAGGNLPSPKKMLERFMTFKTDPMAFFGKAKEDDFSREAFMDIQVLNEGKIPEIRSEYAPEYLNFINNYMIGGEFDEQPPLVKRIYLEHLNIVKTIMQKQMMKLMTQMPTAEEMDAQNRKTMEQAAMDAQMGAGEPGGGGPGQGQQGPPKPAPAAPPVA